MHYTKFSSLEGGSVTVVTCTIHTLYQQHFGVLASCPFVGYVVKRCGMSLFLQAVDPRLISWLVVMPPMARGISLLSSSRKLGMQGQMMPTSSSMPDHRHTWIMSPERTIVL